MMTRVMLAIVGSLLCTTGAVADMLQTENNGCSQPASVYLPCSYTPPMFWAAHQRNTAPALSWSVSPGDAPLFMVNPGSAVFDLQGTPATEISRSLPFELPGRPGDLVYDLTAGGATYQINQPFELEFALAPDESSGWRPFFDRQNSDSVLLAIYPKFGRPWVTEVSEAGSWSELLSISLLGMVMAGLAGLRNRLIPR